MTYKKSLMKNYSNIAYKIIIHKKITHKIGWKITYELTYKKSLIKSHLKITHTMTYKKSLIKKSFKTHQKNQIPFNFTKWFWNSPENQLYVIKIIHINTIYLQKSHSQKSSFLCRKKSHSNVTQKSKFGRPPPPPLKSIFLLRWVTSFIYRPLVKISGTYYP